MKYGKVYRSTGLNKKALTMSKKKNKNIRFEKMLGGMFKNYSPKRKIKDIENNHRHKPKGQR